MKFWLYENKRITGPLEAEVLARRPGFSSRSLVCPAESSGQTPGDWLPANSVPELVGGPSRPPAPPIPVAPYAPGFDSERVASEFETVRRVIAALEMRLRAYEESDTRTAAQASSQNATVQERLERLSDAIAAQDVRTEATDAALAACRTSITELGTALEDTQDRLDSGLRGAASSSSGVKEADAAREHLAGSLRDGLSGLHRLIRATETRLDTLAVRSDGLEAAHAAQKKQLEASLRKMVSETDDTQTLVLIHERIERMSHALAEAQSQLREAKDAEAKNALAAEKLQEVRDSVAGLEKRLGALGPGPEAAPVAAPVAAPPPADPRLDELAAALEALRAQAASGRELKPLSSKLDRIEARLAEIEARPLEPSRPAEPTLPPDRINELATGLVAVQRRFVELEQREAKLQSLAARIDEFSGSMRGVQAALARLEARSIEPAPTPARIEPVAERVETPWQNAPEPVKTPSRRPFALMVAAGSAAAVVVIAALAWQFRGSPPQPQPEPRSDRMEVTLPPAPPPEAPTLSPAPVELIAPPLPPVAPPVTSPPPEEALPVAPPKLRPKTRAERVLYTKAPTKAVPGEVQLLQARATRNGVSLKLSEPMEPKATFLADPPRLVLDFSKAPSELPPRDLGGLSPHVLQVRVRESDSPPRVLWVEIQLDKPTNYKIKFQGDAVHIRFDFTAKDIKVLDPK